MVGFKTLSTYDFLMVAITFIVRLMADRLRLREKVSVVYSGSWDWKRRVTVTLSPVSLANKMGTKSGKLQKFIVGLEHRITLKIEINFWENYTR